MMLFRLYRDSFSGLPATTWLLCLAAFINRCGSMVLPLLNLYLLEKWGYTATEAGAVVTLYGVGSVFGSMIGGRLADRLGCVRVQYATLGAAGVWLLLMTLITDPIVLAAAVFVLGVINDAFRPGSITAVATSVPPELRRKALSLNRLMMNAGWAVGPTVGGNLFEYFDPNAIFYTDGGTCLLACVFLFVFLRGFTPWTYSEKIAASTDPAKPSGPNAPPQSAPPSLGPFRDPHFVWLMVVNFVVITAFMQYFTTGPRILKVEYGYGEGAIFWLLAINPVLIALTEMPIVHLLRNRPALPIVAIGSALIGAGFFCFLLPLGAFAIVAALLVVTVGEVLQMALLGAYINDYAPPERRGSYNGAYGMSFALSLVVAPIAGGWAYDEFGDAALWAACGVTGIVTAALFLGSHNKVRDRDPLGAA